MFCANSAQLDFQNMASISYRNGKYQARIIRKGYPSVTRTFLKKKDAQRWARLTEVEMDSGSFANPTLADKATFKEIIERYMREVTPNMRSKKEDLIRLNAIANRPIAQYSMRQLTPARIAEYRDERLKKVSDGTLIREFAYFSSIINHARREWGINVANPMPLVRKPPVPQGRNRILHEDEKARLFTALEPINRRSIWMLPLVQFALETGMRKGEMLMLQWSNVDVQRQIAFLPITKNGQSRVVPLSKKAIEILIGLPKTPDKRVFPINSAAVSANFAKARQRAELVDFHFHDLRHTAITALAKKLPNVLELASVTGHKQIRMLARYHHPNAEELAKKLG